MARVEAMTPPITLNQSYAEIAELWREVDDARQAGDPERGLKACWAVLEHPCAHHQVVEHEVLDDIHQLLRRLGRYEEAIQAKREAIDAGCRSNPDPEADIAECLVEAGRRAEADALYAELRRRDPDDVWLYNSAGWAYRGIDDGEALRWLLDGIALAIDTGDPEQVIGQLLEMACDCWDGLSQPHDAELVSRVEAFQRQWVRPELHPRGSWAGLPDPPERRCGHCGFDPERPPTPPPAAPALGLTGASAPSRVSVEPPGTEPTAAGRSERAKVVLSLAWFPADDWAAALRRWPELGETKSPDHGRYCQQLEAELKGLAHQRTAATLKISPLTVEELDEVEGEEAGTADGRSHLAAEIARTGRAISWPPARNEPCWCRSGRKYKRCCGPVPVPPADGRAELPAAPDLD